jgi:hypothetical protein
MGTGGADEPTGTGGEETGSGGMTGKVETTCTVEVTSADLSDVVSTVGMVEFESDLADWNDATIEFGLTTSYGMVAPVDRDEEGPTLLLGMTTDTEYHYRVLVASDAAYCYGPDQTIVTGPLAAGGPSHMTPEPGSSSAEKAPGFMVTSEFNGDWLYIFDQDGRIVWFYQAPFNQTSRALLSFDGKYLFAKQLNVGRNDVGRLLRVRMDGSSPVEIDLPESHHDITVTPNGDVVYIRKTLGSTCDSLWVHPGELDDDTSDTLLFDVEEAFPSGGGDGELGNESCHTNSVHYNAVDGGFTASDLTHNAYFKLSATGELLWVLGSDDSSFTGDGTAWERQHGHHLLPGSTATNGVLLFFNNGSMQGDETAMREVSFDLDAGTATFLPFVYDSEHGSGTMGDVQRLPNGNTIVTYSNPGYVQEVGPDALPVQTFELATGSGYGAHRPTLYGPPPE